MDINSTSRVLICKNYVAKAVFFQEILHEYEYEK